ncbi:MAG: tRNA (adenosine(37)-N6)-dimethylallyltransferase MiaA [Deinococcaceae bacterium]
MVSIPLLIGPTASGKTALSLELARIFPIEIVSADALMVYRGMDIGTAKPSLSERQEVPHHLIDIRNPDESYDVTQFVADVERVVPQILAREHIPLIVGGTGFYLSALTQGLPTVPPADVGAQNVIREELAERGLDALLDEIAQIDLGESLRLQRNPRRVVRALEVYRATGRFPSQFPKTQPLFPVRVFALALEPSVLGERIERRVDAMLAAGLVEEVESLRHLWNLGLDRLPTSFQAIGYKETCVFLDAGHSRAWLRDELVVRTRQYAKRQMTWIRTQMHILPRSPAEERTALEHFLGSFG